MFTAERIVFSSRLGPTASYESDRHARKVAREGRTRTSCVRTIGAFAAVRSLGVTYTLDIDPVPIFYRPGRVRPEESRVNEEPEATRRELTASLTTRWPVARR